MDDTPRMDAFEQVGDWMPSSDAILKITVDANVTRRIPAYHIFQSTPVGCYNRLVTLSHLYSQSPCNSKSRTTYVDEDGDIITISSDWELIEAFKQFSDPPRPLRITCTVIERGDGDITEDENNGGAVPIQGLLESVLTVLARAVLVLQGQISQPKMVVEAAAASLAEEVEGNDVKENRTSHVENKEETVAKGVAEKLVKDVIQAVGDHKQREIAKEEAAKKELPKQEVPKEDELKPEAKKDEVTDEFAGIDPEFIHARHTCDGCLKAPIVGIRYHATNLPDYDVCEMCYRKYDGNEITFAPEEADRDKQRQPQWKKRANRGFFARRYPGNTAQSSTRSLPAQKMNDTDALNEAICRSLADIHKETNEADAKPEPTIVVNMRQSQEEVAVNVEVKSEPVPVDSSTQIEEKHTDKAEAAFVSVAEGTQTEERKTNEVKAEIEPVAIDNMVQADVNGIHEVEIETEAVATANVTQPEERLADKTEVETEHVIISSTTQAKENKSDKIETESDVNQSKENESDKIETETEPMISEDVNQAEEVEIAEDEVLAEPISEECNETIILAAPPQVLIIPKDDDSSSPSSSEGSEDWDMVDNDAKVEPPTETLIQADFQLAQAAQMIGSALFISDMSRSAEELTVNQFSTNGSSSTNTEFLSVPSVGSSIPTISSDPNEGSMRKWSAEVEQLGELGFEDIKSVEVLELLQAANVGVDSDERVTVQQVVEYLFKENS